MRMAVQSKPFSVRSVAVIKQQNPCSNQEIIVPFEHGFWLKSVDVIGQCHVTLLGSGFTL